MSVSVYDYNYETPPAERWDWLSSPVPGRVTWWEHCKVFSPRLSLHFPVWSEFYFQLSAAPDLDTSTQVIRHHPPHCPQPSVSTGDPPPQSSVTAGDPLETGSVGVAEAQQVSNCSISGISNNLQLRRNEVWFLLLDLPGALQPLSTELVITRTCRAEYSLLKEAFKTKGRD